jgi:uncharacterized cupredoxin-like copper-binding protein
MRRYIRYVVAALLMLTPAAAPSLAADGQTTVKVALLDMSSVMPMGMMGYGMMGPGWGQGQGMMNPGMMGPGWWQGQGTTNPGMMGPGMMGPGMMGYGMMGHGMMGPGMMMGQGMMGGMMSIRVDQPTVKAGPVTFEVTNWSRSVLHEMLVVSVDNPTAPLPYDYPQARVPEEQIKVLGEAADLQPNVSKTFEVTLTPGSYLLICNIAGHYAAGMAAPLSATP